MVLGETVILALFEVVFQVYVFAPDAVNTTEFPSQITELEEAIAIVGEGFTVTLIAAIAPIQALLEGTTITLEFELPNKTVTKVPVPLTLALLLADQAKFVAFDEVAIE